MTQFVPCIVIPNYNHSHGFELFVRRLLALQVPIIIVNDGSNQETTSLLEKIELQENAVTVLHSQQNYGKGSAVMKGIQYAQYSGFTHALQIDADGQHDLMDAGKFLTLSERNPDAVICGCPVYDESVPLSRLLPRYITHFLVWMETLSFHIKDSMCGFRVYPIDLTMAVFSKYSLGERMDFDIEVLVRLYWESVEIVSVPTNVVYPENGISHFHLIRDNLLLTKMHTRLLFGMLPRTLDLINRRNRNNRPHHWAGLREKGSYLGLRLMLWIYRRFGRSFFLIVLYPVILYYFATAKVARRSSRQYLERIAVAKGEPSLVSSMAIYSHFYAFGVSVIDKIAAWSGEVKRNDVIIHGQTVFDELAKSGKGALFIGSHLGNLELCRALGEKEGEFKINAVVFSKNALKFQKTLQSVNPQVELNLIHVDKIGMETAIILRQRTDAGEVVIIVGDRTSVNNPGRAHYANFLGEKAPFSEGPFVLAGILECPIYLVFCIKEGLHYNIYLEHFSDNLKCPRKLRSTVLAGKIQDYAGRLEYYCLKSPLQWFNFYDFWRDDPTKTVKRDR